MKYSLILTLLLISSLSMAQNQMYDICPLKVGENIPETIIFNANNKPVDLKQFVNNKPTVIIFYRGAWCGYCTQHLAELNSIRLDIEDLGFQIFGITVDQPLKLEDTYVKTKSEIEVFADPKVETITAFGLDWKVDDQLFDKYKNEYQLDLEGWSGEDHHRLPVPAVFIIKEDTIQFEYVNPNYKERLKPETLLAILKTL